MSYEYEEPEAVEGAPRQTGRYGIHPVVTVPKDPQCVAELFAALIRADRRRGADVSWIKRLRYQPESIDRWEAPEECRDAGMRGDCDVILRAAAVADRSIVAVGCVRNPKGGLHVFGFDEWGGVVDPCVARGMGDPGARAYEGAARATIERPLRPSDKIRRALKGAIVARNLRPSDDVREALRAAIVAAEVDPTDLSPEQREAFAEAVVQAAREQLPGLSPEAEEALRAAVLEGAGVRGVEGGVEGILGKIVKAVGTVAAGVTAAVASPAAGVAVQQATGVVADVVGDVEKSAAKRNKPHRAKKDKRDAAPVHEAATAAATAAPAGSERQKAAGALAAVTSPDPRIQAAIRKRLAFPASSDPNPADRARLLAAITALTDALNYRLPIQDAAEVAKGPAQPQPPPEPRREAEAIVYVEPEEDYFAGLDPWAAWEADATELGEAVGCPGSCSL